MVNTHRNLIITSQSVPAGVKMQILRMKLKSGQNMDDPVMKVSMVDKVSLSSACVIELSSCEPLCPLTHCVIYALRSSRNLRVWECLKMPNYSGEFSRTARSSTRWRMTWIYRNNMLKRPDRYTAWKFFFMYGTTLYSFPPLSFIYLFVLFWEEKKYTFVVNYFSCFFRQNLFWFHAICFL